MRGDLEKCPKRRETKKEKSTKTAEYTDQKLQPVDQEIVEGMFFGKFSVMGTKRKWPTRPDLVGPDDWNWERVKRERRQQELACLILQLNHEGRESTRERYPGRHVKAC